MLEYWELKITFPNGDNQKIVNEYLFMLKNKKRAKGAIVITRKVLQSFFQDIEVPFSVLTMKDVERWLTKKKKNCNIGTIRGYLSNLRLFFKYCVAKGSIEKQPIPYMWKEDNGELKIILPNGQNQKIVNEYLFIQKNKQCSMRTFETYRNILQSFFQEIEVPFSELSMEDVEEWLTKKKKDCNRKTIRSYLSVLRTFFNYCLQKGSIEKQPIPYMQKEKEDNYWEVKITLPNEENQKKLDEYLLMLKNEQWARGTICGIRHILQSFFQEIEEPFSTLNMQEVEGWCTKQKKECKKITIYGYLTILRSFFSYCIESGELENQPIPYMWKERNGNIYWKLKIQLANKENQKVINDYLISLKVANYSQETVIRYRYFLQNFFKERKEVFSSLTSNQMQQWFILHGKGFKEVTLKNYLTNLSSFYNFCVEEGYVEKSPIKSRMFPRLLKSIPKYLDREEIAKVRGKSENISIRNRCIFEFLISSGCRISELHQLDRPNVDLDNRIAMVLGKGKKYRQVHFSEKCAILLERYLEKRKDANDALFVSSLKKVTRLSSGQMGGILRQLGKEADVTGTLHPHRLRHTFATELLRKGADLLFIADELGHRDIHTTQIYANLPKQEMISLYRKYMG